MRNKDKKSKTKERKQQQKTVAKKAVSLSQSPLFPKGFWKQNWQAALLIFLLPFLLYGYSISFGYILDDEIVITKNQFTQAGYEGISDIFQNESFVGYFGGEQKDLVVGARYRPLSIVTFAIEQQWFGGNPGISHFINILLYGLTGLLIFRLLFVLMPPASQSKWYFTIPFIAAIIYMLHPIHSECVANIKGRDEIIALLLSLSTLYAVVRYQKEQNKIWFAAGLSLFFLGLLAKENTLTFLAIIPLVLYFFTNSSLKKIAILSAPFLLVSILYIYARYEVIGYFLDSGQKVSGLMNNPFMYHSSAQKFASIFYSLGLYIKLLFFPHPLTHDYYPYQIPILEWSDLRASLSIIFYVALGVFAVLGLKKKSILSFSILFYLATLSIVSNIAFTVGTNMNERFMYMSSFGFCVLIAFWLVSELPRKMKGKGQQLSYGILTLVVIGFSVKTMTRVPDWKDGMALNRAAVKVSTNSARANNFMGVSLYNLGNDTTGNEIRLALYQEAAKYLDRSLEIAPGYSDALKMRAGVYGGIYQVDRQLQPVLDGFYKLLSSRKVIPFINEYLIYLNKFPQHHPALMDFYHKLGWEYYAGQLRNYEIGIQQFNLAYQIQPNDLRNLQDLSRSYFQWQDYPNSIKWGLQGLLIYPENPVLIEIVGLAYQRSGDTENAKRYLEKIDL